MEKKERKRARKKFETVNGKKRKKSPWLMRMYLFKTFHIFVPNLGKIYQLGHKIAFSVKLRNI